MYVPRKRVIAVLAGVLALGSLVFAFAASGSSRDEGNGDSLFRSTLAPSTPTDPAFHGIAPGGVPWVLAGSSVRLKADGEFDLRVEGLVIPALGTPGPVTTVSASLLCGPDTNTGPTVTTAAARLSPEGNARIESTLTLPASCLAPIVVVHPNGGVTRYIAVSGWKS